MPGNESQQRSDGPDFVKALAIALVVLGHTIRGVVGAGILSPGGPWGEVDRIIYLFHMPLFFFLSGLFVRRTFDRLGPWSFLRHKALTLLGPLVAWSYLQSGLQFLFSDFANVQLSLYDVLTAPFPPGQQFWFLWALFGISVAAGVLLALPRWRLSIGMFGIGFVGLAVAGDFVDIGCVAYRDFRFPAMGAAALYFPYFALALLVPWGSRPPSRDRENGLWLAAFVVAVVIFEIMPPGNLVFYAASFTCVLSVCKLGLAAAGHVAGFGNPPRWWHLLTFIGKNSMVIYLAHVTFAAATRGLFLKLGWRDPELHILAGTLAGLLMPLLLVPFGARLAARMPALAAVILPVHAGSGRRSSASRPGA